jgi:hypothetical protein
MRIVFLSLLTLVALSSTSPAQSPTPVVLQAMTPANASQSAVTAGVTTASNQTAIKALQAVKAGNEEILRQQAATLLKLDEMEKAANELRIYSKRG